MQISNLTSNNQQSNSNAKKYILIGLIVAVVLLILLLILVVLYSSMRPQNLTLLIDGQNAEYSQDTFIFDNDKLYVSLKDISNLIGYRYFEGGYKEFTQDKSKCYLQSDDEVVVYESGENLIYKTLNNENILYSVFEITETVKTNNDKLYCLSSDLALGCNITIQYNNQTNQIVINTLPHLYKLYNDEAVKGTYTNVKMLDENFNNKKAILYGMLVVKDNSKYGVISLDGKQTYLDIKYDELDFIESVQQFIAKGDTNYGVIAKDGTQKIRLEYDKLEILDNINMIYYAEKNGKKGVIDSEGNALGKNLYVEYDELGINKNLFPYDGIENPMLLYDNCIIAKRGDKWGVFNKDGKLISDFRWDSLGYVDTKNSRDNLLLVKSVEGIIVCEDGKYGIINSKGNVIVECIFNKIYSELKSGEEKYYLQFETSNIELEDYINAREN